MLISSFGEIQSRVSVSTSQLRRGNALLSNHQFFEQCRKLESIHSQLERFGALEQEVVGKIRNWQQNKISSRESVNFAINNNQVDLVTKVKMIKRVLSINSYAMVIFAILGLVSAPFMFVPSCSQFAYLSTSICSEAISILRGIDFLITKVNSKKFLEKRVCTSFNFQSFVDKYVIEQNHFTPSLDDLTDAKLHNIYLNWKERGKTILHKINSF